MRNVVHSFRFPRNYRVPVKDQRLSVPSQEQPTRRISMTSNATGPPYGFQNLPNGNANAAAILAKQAQWDSMQGFHGPGQVTYDSLIHCP